MNKILRAGIACAAIAAALPAFAALKEGDKAPDFKAQASLAGKEFTFSLKDNLRRDAAIEYLAQQDLTLLEIAQRLGFSEASTFHRAFKHWTGVAPGEYRQAHIARP